jgi:hypothetical protein
MVLHISEELLGAVGASHASSPVGAHDNGAFADLIRLAQNPAQSGLVLPPTSVTHDALSALQLAALGDLGGHTGDQHHVDDGHAAASLVLPAALHDDHSHLAAPVLDHGHGSH